MKKNYLFLLIALFIWGTMTAAPRNAQQALEEATHFFNAQAQAHRAQATPQALSLGWTAKQDNGQAAFYVFNRGEDGGYVLISADDRTRTVLGYVDNGRFDEADMPSNARAWFEIYARAIAHAASLPASAVHAPQAQQSYTPVDPICKTTWNQGAPYNALCPMDGSKRSVTGCVATAAAQVMKVHNHPTKGTGSHSYDWKNSSGTTKTLSANFGSTTYQWSNMLNNYPSSTSGTQTQRNAVATLMYHCGVSCDMNYTSNESGASGGAMMNALMTYFDYDPSIRTLLLDYMGENAFLDAIVTDLQAGRPVYFTAYTPSGGGHAFVCDGIDADGLVHINWGWGGTCDGNFLVTVLNPDEQGIGGSPTNDSYTLGVTAYSQIKPNVNGKPNFTITAESMSVEKERFDKNNDYVIFNANTFCNQSVSTWSGSTVLLVYKNGSLVKKATGYTGLSLQPGYYYTSEIPMYGDLSSLAAGEYEIVPAVGIDDQSGVYVPVYVQGLGEYRCPMTVTSTEIIIGDPINPNVDPTAPTVDELAAKYDVANKIVLAVKFEEQVCNDVVFVGTYNSWSDDPSTMLRFKALEGHDDWYVVEVPYASGAQGKPVQLKEDGTFSWDYQAGDVNAWVYQAGNKATVTAGYEHEANVAYPSAGAYIYKIAYWKEHNVPCEPEPIITVIYLDKDEETITTEEIELHLPTPPEVEGFTFICWQPVASDISKGLYIQAIYEYDGDPMSAPQEVAVTGDKAMKLIREGNVYILKGENLFTITGRKVK